MIRWTNRQAAVMARPSEWCIWESPAWPGGEPIYKDPHGHLRQWNGYTFGRVYRLVQGWLFDGTKPK